MQAGWRWCTASRAAGISARGIKIAVYTFSGLCAGIAGLIYTSNIKSADTVNAGIFTELDAIFAVVVGGTALTGGRFTLAGSLIGALLLQTLAYIVVAGKSTPDGIILTGITVVLLGLLPADHPLIRGDFFETIRLWVILSGVLVSLAGMLLLGGQLRSRSRH